MGGFWGEGAKGKTLKPVTPKPVPKPGQAENRGQRCRNPDICETLGGHRAWGYGDLHGQIKPDLIVLGYGLVEQRVLMVARVVEFGLGDLHAARPC
jgi:hypothetical protein